MIETALRRIGLKKYEVEKSPGDSASAAEALSAGQKNARGRRGPGSRASKYQAQIFRTGQELVREQLRAVHFDLEVRTLGLHNILLFGIQLNSRSLCQHREVNLGSVRSATLDA